MRELRADDPLALTTVEAIRNGDGVVLGQLLEQHQGLANARIVDDQSVGRTLLHVVADWPGHWVNGARTVEILVQQGADVNASVRHPHDAGAAETPLHWAASSDDVAVLDALLDAGADIEAPGAVLTGGAPMSDAVVFAQWNAARRLHARGARTTFWQAAALGLSDAVERALAVHPEPSARDITNAFWHACRGGQRRVAELLLNAGADLDWIGYDRRTPFDVALESGDSDLIAWLRLQRAHSATELG